MIDDDKSGTVLGDQRSELGDLALAEQRGGLRTHDVDDVDSAHVEVDGARQACGLGRAVLDGVHGARRGARVAVDGAPGAPERDDDQRTLRRKAALDAGAAGAGRFGLRCARNG
jgi:hypothetical protein